MFYPILVSALTTLVILFGLSPAPIIQAPQTQQTFGAFAPISVPAGGTGTTTFPRNAILLGNATSSVIASSSPSFGALYATSSIATSTLRYGLNVETGCLAVGGVCALTSSAGITSLNGLTGASQTFSAQGPLLIGSASTIHTFIASSSPSYGELRASTTLAVATTTLSSTFTFGVHGASLLAGSTTVLGLLATSSIETPQIRVSGTATSTFGGGILVTGNVCNTSGFCLNSNDGLVSLGGLTGATQTFVNDTNVTVTSSGSTHTVGWSGTLAISRGGSGIDSFGVGAIILGNGTSALFGSSSPGVGVLYATTTATSTIAGGLNIQSGKFVVENNSGNVGIGTTTPGTKFAVNGDVSISGSTTLSGLLASSSIRASLLSIFGTATSSFTGGLSVGGLTSTGHGLFSGWGGFGTTTMGAYFSIQGGAVGDLFMISSSTAGVTLKINNKGFLGLGGTSTPEANLSVVGSAYVQEYTNPFSATLDIDWSKGNQQRVTLTGASTVTFRGGRDGGSYRLVACQDGTGSRVITWPATSTLSWIGYSVPGILTTTKDRCDVFSFIVTAATSSMKYVGTPSLNF